MEKSTEAKQDSAIALLSGGLDSAVALAHAMSSLRYNKLVAVTFDYLQVNRKNELGAARKIAKRFGVEHRIVGLGSVFTGSALTGQIEIPEEPASNGPDATFVPGRNAVLIAVGTAIAQASGARCVITGCNSQDAAGYPDADSTFMSHMNEAMIHGYGVSIDNPLLNATKADIYKLANLYQVPVSETWSCYRAGTTQCGRCGSCALNEEARKQ